MISTEEKRAALGLTQVDLDAAAERTAFALTCETSGLYFRTIAEMLSEQFARAVFATDLPEKPEWESAALEDFEFDRGEAAFEDELDERDAA